MICYNRPTPPQSRIMAPSAAQQVIDYLRYRSDSGVDAVLSPSDCAEIVAYIDQLRGINVTFAEALAGDHIPVVR